jgi:WD40 repeat protein
LNLETKTNVYEFRLRDHELTIDATLSEDHQYILVKNEEELRVWNTSTKERVLLLYIEEIGCKIEHERFIKQNKYLVLIGEDEKVRVLDFLREREVFKRHVTLGWVSDIVYNDEYLALSGDGGFVLYNLNDWEEVENLNSSINYSMSLSRDGRYLVLALTDGTVTVFDLKNEITYNSSAFVGTNYGVISTRMKDDGTIIVFVMDEDSTPKLFSYNLKI